MNIWLVTLLGIFSTTQTHLAKSLERQGIETIDQLRAMFKRTGEKFEGKGKKSFVYMVGLILNHTTFIYHLFVTPLGGTTAQYTSMYGVGLLVLLLYSTRVMKEHLSRRELLGALTIFLGTFIIGVEGISRPALDMGWIDDAGMLIALAILLCLSALLLWVGLRSGSQNLLGLAYGLGAGICGSLDPFLKGFGQASGEGSPFTPGTALGWGLLAFSFLIGEAAVLITQWGFYKRARASILVPAFNCGYISLPVILQLILLPGYAFYWSTGAGLGLIISGFILIRSRRRAIKASLPDDPYNETRSNHLHEK
jgi:drug/metabolite transporter (DMT)-like permease